MLYNIGDQSIRVGEQDIKVRLWTSKEERAFLSQKSESTSAAEVVKTMILPNIEYKPMTLDEFKYLMFKLRGLSVSPEVAFSYTCNGEMRVDTETGERVQADDERLKDEEFKKKLLIQPCKSRVDSSCSIEDAVEFTPSTLKDGDIIEQDDIKVTLRKIPTKELLLKVLNEEKEEDQKYYEFLACIKEVNYAGETLSSFTFEEVREFFDSVPSFIFKKLYRQFYDIKGNIKFSISDSCPLCGSKNRVLFDDILEFL